MGITSETKIFAFEVKVILSLKSTFPGSQVAKIGLNGPQWPIELWSEDFFGLIRETEIFVFVVMSS